MGNDSSVPQMLGQKIYEKMMPDLVASPTLFVLPLLDNHP